MILLKFIYSAQDNIAHNKSKSRTDHYYNTTVQQSVKSVETLQAWQEVNIDSGKHWTCDRDALASSLGMLVNVMEEAGTCERGGALASILRTKIANLSDPSTSWYKFFFF
ncbi:hypothetical protein J6590_098593 [Homalodisca vitripennis]|nr:hypothetical protein J6590_098593 [Homalodisca vitripennis]